jgi:hypothetical protein
MYKYYKKGVNCKYSMLRQTIAHIGGINTYAFNIIELTLFGVPNSLYMTGKKGRKLGFYFIPPHVSVA